MAKREVVVVTCDKCGFKDSDTSKFLHVIVGRIHPSTGRKTMLDVLTSRDLCIENCVGAPGVNRDR